MPLSPVCANAQAQFLHTRTHPLSISDNISCSDHSSGTINENVNKNLIITDGALLNTIPLNFCD